MKKLFVIGNGFDRAHGLPTSYDDFRKFLSKTYMNGRSASECMPIVPSVYQGPKGEDICDIEEVAEFLVYIISIAESNGNYWSNLEESLGRLDYEEAFDMLSPVFDEDGDIDLWKESYNNEDMASDIHFAISRVKDLFAEWVKTIKVDFATIKPTLYKLIDAETEFLTFNYTDTLERIYGIDKRKVCHIHGKQGERIFFGHGNDTDYTEEYMRSNIGSENYLSELDRQLRKDTKLALQQHQDFFDRIDGNLEVVYSMGFSFGDVDLIYIKEICKRVSDDTEWYLNDYDPSVIPQFKRCLRTCGFKGKIDTFHI